MTISELARNVWSRIPSPMKKQKVDAVTKAIFLEMTRALEEGQTIKIREFGTFSVYSAKASRVLLPISKKEVRYPGRKKVRFLPSRLLREKLEERGIHH